MNRDERNPAASQGLSTNSTASQSPNLQDCLSLLNQKTESLLRTMRLDVVLLGSRDEEMRNLLDRLEAQYELLQITLEDDDAKKKMKEVVEEEGKKSNAVVEEVGTEAIIDWNSNDNLDIETKGEDLRRAMKQSVVIVRSQSRENRERSKQLVLRHLGNDNVDWSERTSESMKSCEVSGGTNSRREDIGRISGSGDDKNNKRLLPRISQPQRNGNVGDVNSVTTSSSVKNAKNNNMKDDSESSRRWLQFGMLNFRPPERESVQPTSFNRDSSHTTRNSATTEATPPPQLSSCSLASSVDNSNSNPEEEVEEGESTVSLTTATPRRLLRLKLHGLDMASSTLHRLLSYRTRELYDLRYQRSTLQSTTSFYSKRSKSELEKLRSELNSVKLERRRKMRMLEDVRYEIQVSSNQEERLRDELDNVRTEMCRLRIEMGTKDD
ncbi:hypothetical protein ACHAW5_005307 [Stephanodiscus triporus]|uniref:Uncharacterized protein n=1 Tax=Stephanodiscus triporus TaxID=2934178 RepID=A0ABD3N904_9STRA